MKAAPAAGTRWRRAVAGLSAVVGLSVAAAGCGHSHPRGASAAGRAPVTPGSASAVATQATIPASLLAQMRPIGRGERFHPAVTGEPTGKCASRPGTKEAHLELFGANRVVLIAAGVGIRARPASPRCYGNAVTIDPTGIIHYRPGATVADVFRAWGEPLSATQMASFRGSVRYYLAGRRVPRVPGLSEHAEIVLEVGPYVPPHRSFSFPPGL